MSLTDALAIVGGLTVVYLIWRVWCGFKEYVLSQFWQEDLLKFGQWAGNVKEQLLYLSSYQFNFHIVADVHSSDCLTFMQLCCVCVCRFSNTINHIS